MALDPDSEQIRDVYAYYGLAMYLAQCLEQSIFLHLLFFDHFPNAVATHTTPEAWAASFDQYEHQELSQTMGKLIRRLRDTKQSTATIEADLENALKQRNWLAHGYFSDRAVEFTQSDGREKMRSELEALCDVFRNCSTELDAITLAIARQYGLTDERLAVVEQEMLDAYANARTGQRDPP